MFFNLTTPCTKLFFKIFKLLPQDIVNLHITPEKKIHNADFFPGSYHQPQKSSLRAAFLLLVSLQII